MSTIRQQIEADCVVLLNRALLHGDVCAFGADGCGKHGTADFPAFYKIYKLDIEVEADDDNNPTSLLGRVWIFLTDYDADASGYILTDKNFEISIRKLLVAMSIQPDVLNWADLTYQSQRSVCMTFDVNKLLGC